MPVVVPQQRLIDAGLHRATEWGVSVSAEALIAASFKRVNFKQQVQWNSPSPRSRKPDLVRRFSSVFISDLITYPGAMADVAVGRPDRMRDAMFFASDKFLALLDFLLGLVYEVLDFYNSGWCDESGLPINSGSDSVDKCSFSSSTEAHSSQAGVEVGAGQKDTSSRAMKQDLANFFYRPRKRRLKMKWELRDVRVPESSDATCRGHGNEPRGMRPFVRRGAKCTCWGWHLDELLVTPGGKEIEEVPEARAGGLIHNRTVGSLVKQIVLAEHRKSGWSECQCEECVSVLMPLELALERLYVRSAEAVAVTSNKTSTGSFGPLYMELCGGSREDSDDDRRDMVFSTDGNSDSSSDSESGNGIRSEFEMYSLPFEPIGLTTGMDSDMADETSGLARNSSFRFTLDSAVISAKPTSAVIFLHGIYSSSTFWFETVIPHLSAEITSKHQILVPDLLGCGKSPRPVDSLYTLEDQVESIRISVLERHDVDSFHIVSHSMGTVVALALAARFPDRVRSLTLIAPLYGGTGEADGVDPQPPTCDTIMALTKPWTLKGMKAIAGKDYYNVSRLIAHVLFTRHEFWVPLMHRHLKRYPISFIEGYFRNSHHATWHMSHNTLLSGTHSMPTSLAKLRQKGKQVLVIHGDVDTTCFYRQSVEMSQHFNNVRLVTAPGKGHVDVIFENERKILMDVESEILSGDAHWLRNTRGTTVFNENGVQGLRTP